MTRERSEGYFLPNGNWVPPQESGGVDAEEAAVDQGVEEFVDRDLDLPRPRSNALRPVSFHLSHKAHFALKRGSELLGFPMSEMFRASVDYLIERLHAKFPDEEDFFLDD